MSSRRAHGDYQTPYWFAEEVCHFLRHNKLFHPQVVLEPTCGKGSFLLASRVFDGSELVGIECNPEYASHAATSVPSARVIQANVFEEHVDRYVSPKGFTLVLGNPPWATNSMLGAMDSANLPAKRNFRNEKGIEACTGGGNFDICESIILQGLEALQGHCGALAMLCKKSVAYHVFQELVRRDYACESCDVYEFDARRVFGVMVDACLLLIEVADSSSHVQQACDVYAWEKPSVRIGKFGYFGGRFFGDLPESAGTGGDIDGICALTWRQGIKHDASAVMELLVRDGMCRNRGGELVDIEETCRFPLVKSSGLKQSVITSFDKEVIVTQHKLGEPTERIEAVAPRTWQYLLEHAERLDGRRSSIYRTAPRFAMFGVGPYAFAPYKVAISGFYKTPRFCLLYGSDPRPVMLDDTCYYIGCDDHDTAYTLMLLLNAPPVQAFLARVACLDSKRPYTKKILERIDLGKACVRTDIAMLQKTEKELHLEPYISQRMLDELEMLVTPPDPRSRQLDIWQK